MLAPAGRAVGDNRESLQHTLRYFDDAPVLAIVGAIASLVVSRRPSQGCRACVRRIATLS